MSVTCYVTVRPIIAKFASFVGPVEGASQSPLDSEHEECEGVS